MELDQLKTAWKEARNHLGSQQPDIGALLNKKSHHPLVLLRQRFRRGMILVPVTFATTLSLLSRHHVLIDDPLFWTYGFFCLMTTIYFKISYHLITKMLNNQQNVNSAVINQYRLLATMFKWRKIGTQLIIIALIIFVETLLHYRQEHSLERWHAQPWQLRSGMYVVMGASLYMLTYLSFKYRYERHLLHLKQLMNQLK